MCCVELRLVSVKSLNSGWQQCPHIHRLLTPGGGTHSQQLQSEPRGGVAHLSFWLTSPSGRSRALNTRRGVGPPQDLGDQSSTGPLWAEEPLLYLGRRQGRWKTETASAQQNPTYWQYTLVLCCAPRPIGCLLCISKNKF